MSPASAPSVTRNTKNASSGMAVSGLRGDLRCHEVIVERVRMCDARVGDLPRGPDRDDLPDAHGDVAPMLEELDRLHARLDRLELLQPVGADGRMAPPPGLLQQLRPPERAGQ